LCAGVKASYLALGWKGDKAPKPVTSLKDLKAALDDFAVADGQVFEAVLAKYEDMDDYRATAKLWDKTAAQNRKCSVLKPFPVRPCTKSSKPYSCAAVWLPMTADTSLATRGATG
jgi:hypothetical protein